MLLTHKARLAVVAVGTAAVGMSVVAPSYAASTPLTFAPSAKATAGGAPNQYDFTLAGAGCTAAGCTTVGVPAAGTTWAMTYHDPVSNTTKTIASGTGNTIAQAWTKNYTFPAPAAGTYGQWKVGLTFTNGSGTTKQTWYSYTAINYGTPSGKPAGPTTLTASTTTPAANAPVTFTISGGTWPVGASRTAYKLDMGMASGSVGNTQTVDAVAGTATLNFAGYPAVGTYTVKAYTFDGLNTSTTFQTATITVGTGGTTPPPTSGVTVSRVSGDSRYLTGIAVSQKAFPTPNTAPAVILATGDNFPDALAGVPLAKAKGAPLLLVPTKGPDPLVTAEVLRVLKAGGNVYVLGGVNAVPDSVITALNLPAAQVHRLAGGDRFETSVKIAGELGNPTRVVLATAVNFPDALAAGPYAANVFGTTTATGTTPAAILLTQDAVLPPSVKTYLASATAVAAVGGQAVSASASLPAGVVVKTFKGNDRYDTAAQVAATFTAPKVAGVAVGDKFADALTGAAFLANAGGPLVLTTTDVLPDLSRQALQGMAAALAPTGTVDIFGGKLAVSDSVLAAVATAVGGTVK
jgi:hypothetical protein